ncbi:MAG: hypothetical protein ACHBN1_08540 [Heteroscytonema crispum UTEX LB 1556]
MDLEIVFNELSLQTPAAEINTARLWMEELINTIRSVKPPSGFKRKLRTKSDFNYSLLAPNYRLLQWRNDPDIDQEKRRFLRTLQDKNDPPLPDIADSGVEVRYKQQQAIGLYYAFVFNSLAISLQSDPQWNVNRLKVEVITLDELDEEEFITTNESVLHVSCCKHVEEHYNWIQAFQERIFQEVSDGLEVWNRREELFPNLEFCDAVRKQLEDIRTGQLELQHVVNILFKLQKCSQNWDSGYFNLDGYSIEESGESRPTLDKYSKERTFRCPDGEERLFERHVKLRSCNWRIHFFPVKPGKVIIGYVGRHLPTVKYQT